MARCSHTSTLRKRVGRLTASQVNSLACASCFYQRGNLALGHNESPGLDDFRYIVLHRWGQSWHSTSGIQGDRAHFVLGDLGDGVEFLDG